METQARPAYYVLRDGKPVSVVSLRNHIDQVTDALLGDGDLSPEEMRMWKSLNYPLTMVSFEAYETKVNGDFMGKDQSRSNNGPLLFRLMEKHQDVTSITHYATEVEMRAAFKAIVSHYSKFPGAVKPEPDSHDWQKIAKQIYEEQKWKKQAEWKKDPEMSPYDTNIATEWLKEVKRLKW